MLVTEISATSLKTLVFWKCLKKTYNYGAPGKRIFWRKITSTKMEKICWQITPAAEVDHRGSGTDSVWENIGVSCICYLSKTHFVRDFLQNSIGNSSTSTTCNPIYNAGTSLQLQITMEFCRPHMHEKQLKPHLQCGTDPRPIRDQSEDDPTTHETVSHPSHRRGRSSRFGDRLCMEKHRVSCICYLSKTHFVRDFLQNSIGNSSGSTTCNPICTAGTINALTNSCFNYPFPWPTFDELFLRRTLSLTNCFFD